MKREVELENAEIEHITVKKVKNGYVVGVTTEAEEFEMICSKRVHVLKLIKELFKE